ncbi:Rpp14 family protein [Trichuris trichiura]|uniref:Ribonuclease P/MRP protein subunit POP5 n=1 Tax=Trichuris trichiura TaxID=36087 RepID=A0A077ZKB8_TRITR|nr:Rpp14 family protein [Trichuris trichiura]
MLYQLLTDPPDSKIDCSSARIYSAICAAIRATFGEYGLGRLKVHDACTKIVVVRVEHKCAKFVSVSIPFIKKIHRCTVIFKCIYVGGSMRCCARAAIRHHREELTIRLPRSNPTG